MAKKKKQPKPVTGLPLNEDHQEVGVKYDPSQVAPKPKKSKEK